MFKHKIDRFTEYQNSNFWSGRNSVHEINDDRLVLHGGGSFYDSDGDIEDPATIHAAEEIADRYNMIITRSRGAWWGYSEYTPDPGDVSIFEWIIDPEKPPLPVNKELWCECGYCQLDHVDYQKHCAACLFSIQRQHKEWHVTEYRLGGEEVYWTENYSSLDDAIASLSSEAIMERACQFYYGRKL